VPLAGGGRRAGNRPAIKSGAIDPAQRPGIRRSKRRVEGRRPQSSRKARRKNPGQITKINASDNAEEYIAYEETHRHHQTSDDTKPLLHPDRRNLPLGACLPAGGKTSSCLGMCSGAWASRESHGG
jgi:hypothetical protein